MTLSAASSVTTTVNFATADGTALAGAISQYHKRRVDFSPWRNFPDNSGDGERTNPDFQ